MNLFLTEAPLLLDVRSADAVPLPAPARPPRLLYPAQLQTHKNHRALVRGVEVLRRSGTDVVLLCPGSDFDAELSDEIMEVVAASGCEALFEFLGRVDDDALVDLYSRCDGVIVPSVAEGGAYVPLEAIAPGRPVAVNDIESTRMHLEAAGGEVIWFDASDSVSTADAMVQLVPDTAALFDRNAECRARLAQLNWADVARTWNLIIDAVDTRGTRPQLSIDRHGRSITYSVPPGAPV